MKYFKLLVVVALAGIIGYFSLNQVPLPAGGGNDKIAHFSAYLGLVLAAALLRPKSIAFYTSCAILYGGLIEFIQPSFGREKEVLDFVANSLGAISGGTIGLLTAHFRKSMA